MKLQAVNKISEYILPITIEKDATGAFIASSPVWADCYAQGDTVQEAYNEAIAVATSLIELYKEEGLNIPLKSSQTNKVTFEVPVLTE